jgi:hypothetical protein
MTGLPKGFHVSTPLTVQPGLLSADGVINIDLGVPRTLTEKDPVIALRPGQANPELKHQFDFSGITVTATALIGGREVVKTIARFETITILPKPNYLVKLELDGSQPNERGTAGELAIAPGTTVTAMLRIKRNGYKGELKFDVGNLPHGVIVDNIGLSGVLIREGELERQIFLTAADWVPETTRLIHARANQQGNGASWPMLVRVRKPAGQIAQSDPSAAQP